MTQALKSSDVSYVLLDMYVPVTRKDLFNGTWFDVVDILEGEIQHGVLLQGDGVRLAQTMKNLLIKDDIQTKFLIEAGASETSEVRFSSSSLIVRRFYETCQGISFSISFYVVVPFYRFYLSYIHFINFD